MGDGRAVSAAEIETALLALAAARGPDRSIDPSEVARTLAGDDPNAWGRLMGAVRRAAVRLMKEGRVTILRKGKPVDPDDFRGVYRIRIVGPHNGDD
jgi:uncharacterized protein DUF3253